MGLRKGTVTFSRYRLIGTLPDHFPEFFNERIRKNAFQNLWRIADEKVLGWTDLEDPQDTDFPNASCASGRYLLFSLRIDRKSAAPSLLRLRVSEAERSKLKETGQKKLYREQREAMKEAVRLELLGQTLPIPSFFEICWSVRENTLIFCSLSDKVFDELRAIFSDSFQLICAPYLPWDPQLPAASPIPRRGVADSKGPGAPPKPSAVPPDAASPKVGREFLTWLWFKSEERNGRVLIPGAGECEVFFIRRLVLESGEGEYAETVVCQGLHAVLEEGKEALRQGKKITAARLRIAYDKTEWEFTFKADRFHFQSMKLPTVADNEEEETDREGQLLERISLIEKAVAMMELLFQSFLERRSSKDWEAELSRIQKWILPHRDKA
jgi:recombination associated protein RdgC